MLVQLRNLITQLGLRLDSLNYKRITLYGLCLISLGLILNLNLGYDQLLPGYSESEITVANITDSFPNPTEDFLYWSYYTFVYGLRSFITDGVFAARWASTILAFSMVVAFFFLLRRKFNLLISILGAVILISNSWILQLARAGTPEISTIATLVILLTCFLYLKDNPSNLFLRLLLIFLLILGWFIPLIPWLIVTAIILFIRHRKQLIRYVPLYTQILYLTTTVALITFMIANYQNDQSGIPIIWGIAIEFNIQQMFINLLDIFQALVWRAPDNPSHWLGRLPFLDIVTGAMIPFGIYAAWSKLSSSTRRYSLILIIGMLGLLVMNQGVYTPGFSIFLFITLLTVVAGISLLYTHWTKFFPVNSLARRTNLAVIVILVSLSSLYQLQKYFIAWSNHPETRSIYSQIENINPD